MIYCCCQHVMAWPSSIVITTNIMLMLSLSALFSQVYLFIHFSTHRFWHFSYCSCKSIIIILQVCMQLYNCTILWGHYCIAGYFRGSSIRPLELNFVVLKFVARWAVIWTWTFEHVCNRCSGSAAGLVWERLQCPLSYLGGYTIESTQE